MSDEEQTRDEIEENVNDEFTGVSQDPPDGRDNVPSPPVKETVIEAAIEEEEHKAKPVVKQNLEQKQNRKSK